MASLSDLAGFGTAAVFGAEPYARGVDQRQNWDAQKSRNRLLELSAENRPTEISNQNRMDELAIQKGEQGVTLGDQKINAGAMAGEIDNARTFVAALGPDFEQLDPATQQQQWMAAREKLISMDPSNTDMPEQFESGAYRLARNIATLALEDEAPNVGAQKILEDGTIIQSTEAGPRVWSPTGEVLSGQAAADAVRAARDYQVSNQLNIYGARREGTLGADINLGGAAEGSKAAGKQAIEQSGQMFDQLGKVKGSIANIDEAIRLIDEGAGTGPVMSRLPSIRSASVQLDNLQGRMGLDVINSTTFGALSEAELRFALSTALPENLDGPELKSWLQRKKASQEKLANYLQEAATFLGRPGNSVAEWMDLQRGRGGGGGSGVDDILSKYGVE